MDFVYGSISDYDKTVFVPLDGQQRLTTLFLLHWYLSSLENSQNEFKKHLLTNFSSIDNGEPEEELHSSKSRFSYETRTSSRDFCNALINGDIDFSLLSSTSNSLSELVKDSPWFYLSWIQDPTINAMLHMLDAINAKFKDSKGFWGKLKDIDQPIITFQFLNLKEFDLTDDLYIKMNARGKLLTSFENFKAKLVQAIDTQSFDQTKVIKFKNGDYEKKVSIQEYFSRKIDTDWADLFWNYSEKKDLFDQKLLNFFKVIIAYKYFITEDKSKKLRNAEVLHNNYRDFSFQQYDRMGCVDRELTQLIISILDLLSSGSDEITYYLAGSPYYDELKVFKSAISNDLTYTERLQFFAFYMFLVENGAEEGLKEWMRVIYNLTENTIYDRLLDYERSLRSINSLLPHSKLIQNYLADPENKIDGFSLFQIAEERIKASLILKNEQWRKAIIDIERHGYFDGQIGFLLSFSGVEDYYSENKKCDWSNEMDNDFLEKFKNYSTMASKVFSDNGLSSFPNHLWQRALLTKGDFLLTKGSNSSFLKNYDRDISWKRLLRDDNSGKRDLVKSVFDDPCFDRENMSDSLGAIITKSEIDDWRVNFIYNPNILAYLGPDKYIRWNSEYDIYLLEKTRLSGAHVDYFSYSFYLENIKGNEFLPFKDVGYYIAKGDYYTFFYFDNWAFGGNIYEIWVTYRSELKKYLIEFIERDKNAIHDAISNVLKDRGMVQPDEFILYKYNKTCVQKKLLDQLNQICSDLSSIE